MLRDLHSLVDAGLDPSNPPLVVIKDGELGLVGMAESTGSGPDGKAASQIVLDAVRTHLALHADLVARFGREPSDLLRNEIITVMREAVTRAGREAFALRRRKRRQLEVGLDLVLVSNNEAFAAHVGHGQIYLLRRELLHRLALTTPGRGNQQGPAGPSPTDTRFPVALLGVEPSVHVETLCLAFSPGDRIVVVSPGMAQVLDERDVRTLSGALPPPQAMQGLVHLARERNRASALGVLVYQVPGEARGQNQTAHSRLGVLSRMPLFNYCSKDELLVVAAVAHPQRIPGGSRIFQQGAPGQEIFLVVNGEVIIVQDGFEVLRLGPGSNFGEMSMLDEPRRSASAVAAKDTELLVIRREAFFSLLMGNPTLAVKILWNMLLWLSGHLRKTTSRLAEVTAALNETRSTR